MKFFALNVDNALDNMVAKRIPAFWLAPVLVAKD